jgi:hypothetical protein
VAKNPLFKPEIRCGTSCAFDLFKVKLLAPSSLRVLRHLKWVLTATGFVLVLGIAFAFWPYRFYYDSFCSQCGAYKWSLEWQLPHSEMWFFRHSRISETALSRYLTSSSTVSRHVHRWLFAHGGGNGIRCALGDGDSIRSSMTSSEVARFLQATRAYGGSDEYRAYLRLTFDRDHSLTIRMLANSIPTNGFQTKAAYHSWIEEQAIWVEGLTETHLPLSGPTK